MSHVDIPLDELPFLRSSLDHPFARHIFHSNLYPRIMQSLLQFKCSLFRAQSGNHELFRNIFPRYVPTSKWPLRALARCCRAFIPRRGRSPVLVGVPARFPACRNRHDRRIILINARNRQRVYIASDTSYRDRASNRAFRFSCDFIPTDRSFRTIVPLHSTRPDIRLVRGESRSETALHESQIRSLAVHF